VETKVLEGSSGSYRLNRPIEAILSMSAELSPFMSK